MKPESTPVSLDLRGTGVQDAPRLMGASLHPRLPQRPGLGITIDEAKLARYRS